MEQLVSIRDFKKRYSRKGVNGVNTSKSVNTL